MVRKGRDFELLVASLEDYLSPLGIEVASPDRIKDKDTDQTREVDISLKGKIGSSEVLVIIECRDRNDNEDVRWIEELAGKRDSVGADKAMAVSSNGFTEPARRKAEKWNIELRTIIEVDLDEIGKWFEGKEGIYFIPNALFKDLSFILFDGTIIDEKGLDFNKPVFRRKKDGKALKMKDVWDQLPKPVIFSGIPDDGTHVERIVGIKYKQEGEAVTPNDIKELENLQLLIGSDLKDIKEINFRAEFWVETKKVPVKVKQYTKQNGVITEVAEFEYEDKGKKYAIEILGDSSSNEKRIVLIPKGHEDPGKLDISFTLNKKSQKGEYLGSQDYYIRFGLDELDEKKDSSPASTPGSTSLSPRRAGRSLKPKEKRSLRPTTMP